MMERQAGGPATRHGAQAAGWRGPAAWTPFLLNGAWGFLRPVAALSAVVALHAACPAAPLGNNLPVWPAPPDPPRVAYVASLRGGEYLPAASSWWSRAYRFAVGLPQKAAVRGGLARPFGLAVGADGTLWVADAGRRAVVGLDIESGHERIALTKMRRGALQTPVGVAVSTDGATVYVVDAGRASLAAFGREGRCLWEVTGPPLVRPAGVAVAPGDGRVYVSDPVRHAIHIYDRDGRFRATRGRRGRAAGEFNYPTFLWTDRAGRLGVTDTGNFRVQWLSAEGAPLTAFGEMGDRPGYLARPKGGAMDREGHLYLVDGAMETVQIFDGAGRLLLYFGRTGSGEGEFSLPAGVAVDGRDRIFVADAYNGRVQVFQYLPSR